MGAAPGHAIRDAPERQRTFPTRTYPSPILLGVELRRMGEKYVHVGKVRWCWEGAFTLLCVAGGRPDATGAAPARASPASLSRGRFSSRSVDLRVATGRGTRCPPAGPPSALRDPREPPFLHRAAPFAPESPIRVAITRGLTGRAVVPAPHRRRSLGNRRGLEGPRTGRPRPRSDHPAHLERSAALERYGRVSEAIIPHT